MELPATLTEAQSRNGFLMVTLGLGSNYSSGRHIPYAERYRASTGLMETPIERLQRAAEDEKRRQARR